MHHKQSVPWPIKSNGDKFAKINTVRINCTSSVPFSTVQIIHFPRPPFFHRQFPSDWPTDNCFSQPSSTLYSQICNTSSAPHIHHMSTPSQQACCIDQDFHLGASGNSVYNGLYPSPTSAVCPSAYALSSANYPYDHLQSAGKGGKLLSKHNVCMDSCVSNMPQQHLPHSKSFEHYHEPAKLVDPHVLRHSFDNYKNYDCLDSAGMGSHHHGRATAQQLGMGGDPGIYDRYQTLPSPMTASSAYTDPHIYSQLANFDRNDSYANVNACCHQNQHYDCLTAFGGRTSSIQQPGTGHDYGNYNFPPK